VARHAAAEASSSLFRQQFVSLLQRYQQPGDRRYQSFADRSEESP
jgi:hypothetical protein